MKKNLTTLLAVTTVFLSLFAFYPVAHAAVTCAKVDASNYIDCCTGDNAAQNDAQCTAYENSNTKTTTTTTTPPTTTTNTASSGCSTVTSGNYDSCCAGENAQQNDSQCSAYENSSASTAAANTCSTVTSSNYNSCCLGSMGTTNKTQCSNYEIQAAATANITLNCNTLTPANSGPCCVAPTTDTLKTACAYYNYTNPTAVSGQAGSQNTGAINGATNSSYGTYSGALSPSEQKAITACTDIKFNTLLDIAIWAKCLIGAVVIPGIFTLAFVVFLWGVFKFIRSPDIKDKNEGKQFIYMGLIGLFVMVSVWGIIKIASTTLGIDSTVPALQTDYLSTSKASKKTTAGTTTASQPSSTTTGSQ